MGAPLLRAARPHAPLLRGGWSGGWWFGGSEVLRERTRRLIRRVVVVVASSAVKRESHCPRTHTPPEAADLESADLAAPRGALALRRGAVVVESHLSFRDAGGAKPPTPYTLQIKAVAAAAGGGGGGSDAGGGGKASGGKASGGGGGGGGAAADGGACWQICLASHAEVVPRMSSYRSVMARVARGPASGTNKTSHSPVLPCGV